MSDDNKIVAVIQATEGLVKAVPVYQDAIQPAAIQVGKGLETIAKTINVALAPVSALVWGYEKISVFLNEKLTEKLKNIPPERITTPNLLIAGPVLESLKFAANEEGLRELYANLLATSIDSKTAQNAHPGFVQIIQSMSPDEAKILQFFSVNGAQPLIDVKANIQPQGFHIMYRNFSLIGRKVGCEHQQLVPNYIDNLCRLGILEIPPNRYIITDGLYEELESDSQLSIIKQRIEINEGWTIGFDKKKIELTDL